MALPDDRRLERLQSPVVRRATRICYAGTWERDYPRNRLIIDALRLAGVKVEEAHVPVFERTRDKSGAGLFALGGLALRLVFAYLRLVPDVALRLLRCDALVVGYIGQLDAIILGAVARVMGRPLIFNPLVTLTDTVVEDRQRFREGSAPARMIAAIDRLALRMSTLVITDTASNAHYLTDRFGVEPAKISVVPVGAEETIFFPAEPAPTQEARAVLDVVFVGKFIPLHGIDTIIRAAAILMERDAPLRIELVGTGQTYAEMRALADRLTVDSLVWTDWIPFDQLGDRLRQADVALGVFDEGAKARRVIPNKVYQSIACAVATVTRCSPDVETLLRNGESALLVPPADAPALADALESLVDPSLRQRIAAGGRRAFVEHASLAALARDLQPALDLARGQR
jgi:glycosyltransferase involved in cell wall biosynthesis